jgi:hypothetical protein
MPKGGAQGSPKNSIIFPVQVVMGQEYAMPILDEFDGAGQLTKKEKRAMDEIIPGMGRNVNGRQPFPRISWFRRQWDWILMRPAKGW